MLAKARRDAGLCIRDRRVQVSFLDARPRTKLEREIGYAFDVTAPIELRPILTAKGYVVGDDSFAADPHGPPVKRGRCTSCDERDKTNRNAHKAQRGGG